MASKSNPIIGLVMPWGFHKFEVPRFQDNWHMKVIRLSALCTGCLYPPGSIPVTHFCWRLGWPQGHGTARRIMSMENSHGIIGNQTRNLLACSAMPQPTVPPCTLTYHYKSLYKRKVYHHRICFFYELLVLFALSVFAVHSHWLYIHAPMRI